MRTLNLHLHSGLEALAKWAARPRKDSQAGRTLIAVFLCFAWLSLPSTAISQPNYTNETDVAWYVRQMLYWPTPNAAFAYKDKLYTNQASVISPQHMTMASLYGQDERDRASEARIHLERGLTNNPQSVLLADLLMDLYYDRTVAETILAREAFEKAERAHFGPPIAGPAPVNGFIIDNEIAAYATALQLNRTALASYCELLTDNLGLANGNSLPLGYRIFQERVPVRGLEPARYLSNGVQVCVTAETNALFGCYKDLVLLEELLRDEGRMAGTLARLLFLRGSPGDAGQAEALVAGAERSLLLHAHAWRSAFPALNPNAEPLANSGLATAMAGVGQALEELEQLRELRQSRLNPMGFEDDFLVLVQGAFAGESPRSDSYDAFLVHLSDPDSVLGRAASALAAARSSYANYRGAEDDLAAQFASSTVTYYDRLRDIVGYFPYDAAYAGHPQGAPGSELDLQNLSIAAARLQIQKNQVEIANLRKQADYELQKAANIQNVYIEYGNKRAAITEWIGLINAAQAAANELAAEAESAGSFNLGGAAGHGANALVQYAAEIGKGLLEAKKERLAAAQSAEIVGIEARTTVKILMLQMNTLAIDSLSAALQLRKEMNRLQDLYREKAQLEGSLKEKDHGLTRRYFADPVHRLALHADMITADLRFQEAQKWIFLMARALEYKWNQPLEGLLGKWRMSDLFKLRNADELQQMYAAMRLYDDEHVMSTTSDDRFDWFSVREQFLGYTRSNSLGQVAYYVDPVTGQTNDALAAFRLHLSRLVTNGWIELDFSTVREIENRSFFRGPTYFSDGSVDPSKPGYYLDKIRWLKIRLPGDFDAQSQGPVSGYLRYGGTSYLRNAQYGTRDPQRADRIVDEMTAYSTRHWKKVSGRWQFSDGINAGVSMLKVARAETRLDGNPARPDVLPSVNQIDVFRERAVAASRWHLAVPVTGAGSVPISNLDDIEIYFYHWSFNR